MPTSDAPSNGLDPFASRTRTRELVEQLPVVVYVVRDQLVGGQQYMSPNVEKILGIPPSGFIEDPDLWARSIHPADRRAVLDSWEKAWRNGSAYRAEYRMVRPDGEEVWVRDSCVLVLSHSGSRLAWQGIIEDLTTEKRSREDVRASEAKYRALVERIPAVVYEMGPDDERRTLYVSPHVEEVLGYTRAEWLDQPDIWIELLHADDREVVLEQHDRHNETGEPWDLEYRLIANDGRVVWVHDRASLIRGGESDVSTWHGVMIDVTAEHDATEMLRLINEDLERRVAERTNELQETLELMALEIGERRRMEGELRQLEERYRSLVEDLPGIAYVWDVFPGVEPRSFRYVSPRIQDILGFSPEEWQASARVHPHDVARVNEAVERSARTGEPFLMEYRYLAKDGSVVCVLDHASMMTRSDEGEPSSFHGVMLDITSRKEAESKAAAAEDRYRNLTERGPVVAYSYELTYTDGEADPSLHVSYVSPQAEELVRYPMEHWLHDAAAWIGMVHPDDRERVVTITTRNWLTGEPWTNRYRMIRSDGTVIWLLDAGRLLDRDDLGRPHAFQGILLDITHDEEARASLEASAREQGSVLDGALAIPWAETVQPDTMAERYTYIGPQSLDILGYTPEELMVESTHFPRMVHPDDRDRVTISSERSVETGLWDETYRVLRRDGEIRWLHSFGRRTSAADEVPELWQGIAVDVTATRASTDSAMAGGMASERDPVGD